jgi:nicotinamidase/pyrazinamidase
MQRDFASPEGSLFVPGAPSIRQRISLELLRARDQGAPIVWTQDWHPKESSHFAPFGGTWPIHCVAESEGAEIVPELALLQRKGDIVIRKGIHGEDGFSAFSVRRADGSILETELHEQLKERGVQRLKLCGVATDWCVRATALDALTLGYDVEIIRDGVAGINLTPEASKEALLEVEAAGGVLI